MKINNKFFICAMLVLMLFLCISASSAAEPLTEELGADIADELAIDEVSDDAVSASEGGDYETISAVGNGAAGGDVISVDENNTAVIVTNDTFYNYFDEDGFLNDSVKDKELTFKGEFSNLSKQIILDRAITIKGDGAVLKDIAFVIDSKNVELNDLTLIANGSLGNLISVLQSNVNLYNLDINYIVDDEMANAISVSGTNVITDVNILNNTIYFESHVTTDEDLTTAINLESADDILIDNNDITADIPALYVETYDYTYFMMGLCYVNPIRIYESAAVNFTNNRLNVKSNSFAASYPTIQAMYIVGSEEILVKGNNVTMKDEETPQGTATYLYAVECGFSSEISFIENNFDIKTTGGKSASGSAYALQIATSDAEIIGNTIVCDSNGPNLGVYSPYGFGPARDLVIKDNFINVTGYAAGTGDMALISGIEVQTGYATIYNNTIYSMNKGTYNARYPVTAVSAVQYSASTLSFDIKDNEIYTNGRYAVDIRYKVNNANVTGNYMEANTLKGDDAAYIKSGTGNVIENNYPTIGVVTNSTFFNFFDENGVLKDNKNYIGLIFDGNFSNLVDTIVINKAFKALGNNTVLDNIAVRIEADNVALSGFTINANKEFADNNGALIYATGSEIEIDDVSINYTAPSEAEAIAIYANAADNFVLSNSEIMYVSNNPGSKHNYGLEVRDSDNVSIENNKIDATLPAVPVSWSATGIDQDLVLAVGIQGGENINFTSNVVDVKTNGGIGSYPTIDAVMMHSSKNVLINLNNITHVDTTTSDSSRYYYSVDLYNLTATVEDNNIVVNTTAGVDRAGTAYPIQLTGPFTVAVKNNKLTAISKGPTCAIYASNWAGYGTLILEDNIIDVTGYATTGNYALVSGIEAEIDALKAYNNIITVNNSADYNENNQVYGISMASSWFSGTPYADINDNIITVDGKYTVYYGKAANTNVTYNTLYAHELEGDDSVIIAAGENNTIENNQPPFHFDVIIDINGTWVGYDVPVSVIVKNATGTLATGKLKFKISDTEFTINLVNGQANYKISSDLVSPGENEIVVEYVSNNETYRPSSTSAIFYIVDGIVNQDNYMVYFNQNDNGRLFDYVPEGATLDFQGSIINPDQAITVQMNVNKPVNIISSTGDAYVDLNTTAGSLLGESPGNSFAITKDGSGTNVTGINFHNTQLWISNTHDVILDNISVVVEDQRVGSGVGATTIRDNSSNVVLKNSYLYTRNNGGSTTFTMSWTTNCTIDNCTIKAEGNVGNLIYLNIYNIVGAPSGVPLNNYNTVSNNRIYGKEGSSISVGLMVEGTNNLIVNNTLYKASISNSFGGQKPANNTYVGNTMTDGSGLTAQANSIVYGNNVTGSLTTGAGSIAYDNIVGKSMTVTKESTAYNNTVATSMSVAADSVVYNNTVGTSMSVAARANVQGNVIGTSMTVAASAFVYHNIIGTTVAINGANVMLAENNIGGAVTIAKAATGTTLLANIINATVTVNSNNNNIKENDITTSGDYAIDLKASTGNNVTLNNLTAKLNKGDLAVKYTGANVVENNTPVGLVTNKTFFYYFDENGVLTASEDYTGLVFKGEFSNLVDTIVFNRGLEVTGDKAVLDNIAVRIETKGFDLSGFTINANKEFAANNGAAIYATGSDIAIDDVVVNYTAPSDAEAIGIYAEAVNQFGLSNSEIIYVATNPGTKYNYGLKVRDSNNVVIGGNKINAALPAADVNWNGAGIDQDRVLVAGIQSGENITFINNVVDVTANGAVGSWPTLDTIMVDSADNVVIGSNNITFIDVNTTHASRYYYTVDLYNVSAVVEDNNIFINTTSGLAGSGAAYPVQITGPSKVVVNNNNITSIAKGPVLGVYAANAWNKPGPSDLTVTNNFINITGNAAFDTSGKGGLVSGIDSSVIVNRIYNNVIYAQNIADYNDTAKIYGISYAQSGSTSFFDVQDNFVITNGKYAVYLKDVANSTVTYNTLYANELAGDDSVLVAAGENNTVEYNQPPFLFDVIIDVNDVWIGDDVIVNVTVVNETGAFPTGKVSFKIKDTEFIIKLVDGKATYKISPDFLVIGENEIVVDYISDNATYKAASASAKFQVMDGIITNATYANYFDKDGNLFDYVPEGATLDFQGLFLGKFPVYIDKSVNVISSTGDALFDSGATYAGNAINSFNIVAGGDNTNITGLNFINYCLYIKGASNVTVDSISIVANKRGVGSGTGFLSIHTGAYNTLVKNGYFENGGTGSSLLVLGKGGAYATFDHNVFNITGKSGNILSANQFVGTGAAPEHVSYTNNVLYNSQPADMFCYAMTVSGSGNLLENNTIYHNGSGILNQYGATSSGNVYRNNTLYGNTNFNPSANSIVENNKIYATTNIADNTTVLGNTFVNVAISGTNTTFAYNEVNGTVTVKGNNNTIAENTIVSAGDYAVDLQSTTGNDVSANYLISSLYKGDAAVKYADENNFVEDNDPRLSVDVTVEPVLIGSDATVTVNVVNGTGNVTIKVNNKTYIAKLDENGTAVQVIPAEDLVAGANNVTVTYEEEGFLPAVVDAELGVLDGVITNETYKLYFDEKGNLVDTIPDGATLDFQGLFLGKFPVYIDKSVNVISSTGDALFDAGATYAGNAINSFNIVAGGDNTNITGLDFINYCLYIKGASNVTVDSISIVANKRGVGSGTGFLSIHTGAYNTLVKNGYFENGGTGSSLLVLGKGGAYATFDHNVFNITGSSGNILSANQFVGQGDAPEHVAYTNNVLYNSQPGSAFCYAMTVSGSGNLLENNTIYHNGSGILNQYGATSSGNVYRNNTLYGNTNFNPSANSIVENNKIYTTTNIAANTTAVGNTFFNVAISGTNTTFADNNILGTVTVSGNENRIVRNGILSTGDYAIDLKSTTGNNVTDNILYANEFSGNDAVKFTNENIVEHNYPLAAVLVVEAKDINVGENATIDISFNENVTGVVEVIVDGKSYTVGVTDGKGQLIVSDLVANEYNVGVKFNGDAMFFEASNSTVFTVNKVNVENTTNITIPSEVKIGDNATVEISVPNATGNVSVIVDGKETVVPLVNGSASVDVDNLSSGNHSVVVIYSGDETHAPTHAVSTITVPEPETPVTNITIPSDLKPGDNATVDINIPDATGSVSVIVDGKETVVPLVNGSASVDLDNLSGGNHSVVVIYSGDETHAATHAVSNFTVPEEPAVEKTNVTIELERTSIESYSIDSVEKGKEWFVAILKDADGKAIVNASVEATFGGKVYNLITDKDGKVKLQINMRPSGLYTATFVFLGDEKYNANMTMGKVTVNKKVTSFKASAKTFKASTKVKKYTVTLTTKAHSSADGKAHMRPVTVYLTINGKTFSAKTDNKGKATFKITNLKKKAKYVGVLKFNIDKGYKSTSKKVTITVK